MRRQSTSERTRWALATGAAATLAAALLLRPADDPPQGRGRTPAPAAVATEPAPPAVAAPRPVPEPAAAAAAKDRSRQLELPDGTFVEALNGAVDPAPLVRYWGPVAWSPIVGIERSSAGVDWYRHANGSYSTTQMVWRSDLGRNEAMTRVAHEGPPAPPAAATGR